MMDFLQTFYEDFQTREAVKAAIIERLKSDATDAVFKKQSTAGLYEANRAVERFFEDLSDKFGKKKTEKSKHESPR